MLFKLSGFRAAKRNMDEKSFYGGVLHVCYVPEYETVEDTRLKLQDRRSYIARAARSRGMITLIGIFSSVDLKI